jgi:hypothetical protein
MKSELTHQQPPSTELEPLQAPEETTSSLVLKIVKTVEKYHQQSVTQTCQNYG